MRKLSLAISLLVVVAVLVAACQGPAKAPKASPSSIAKGGTLYDKWWKAAEGATAPQADHPLWSSQSANTRSDSDTWRCKECHGWDYRGKDGAYSQGPHFTGFPGVYNASNAKTKSQLRAIMTGGANSQHDFSSVLKAAALDDLVNFLKEGLMDDTKYIDYNTKKPIGADVAHGKQLFTSTCAACHGADGKLLNFGSKTKPEYVGTVANGNPWEALHKIRLGQPGTGMPAGVTNGWSVQDEVDVLGYLQTLPE